MKIYDMEGAPNTSRIRIVVEAKGLEDSVQYERVDLISAQQKTPEYLAKNPIGKIPLLELDDGTVISESTAITEYLDNLDGKPLLTGTTPLDKALIHMMQRRVEQLVLEPLDDFFHYGTPGLGSSLKPWRMPDWEHRGEWGARRGDLAAKGFAYFDEILADRPYLATDSFTLPDITLYISLIFADYSGIDNSQLSNLVAWRAKVAELPAVKGHSGQQLAEGDFERLGK